MNATIKRFIQQDNILDGSLKYNAGVVMEYDGTYAVSYEQMGSHETFSIGQPVFDGDNNLMGFLGINFFRNLDTAHRVHNISIPCMYWQICNPTKHCKSGKKIHTYWQNFNETEKKGIMQEVE